MIPYLYIGFSLPQIFGTTSQLEGFLSILYIMGDMNYAMVAGDLIWFDIVYEGFRLYS